MSLFSIIIWVIIVFSIVNNIKKKNSGVKPSAKPNEPRRNSDVYQVQGRQVNPSGQPQPPRPMQPQNRQQSSGYNSQQAAGGNPSPVRSRQTEPGQMQQKEKSTTELLREKAMQDEMEHRREKQQQERENELHHGKIRYAQRLIEGDPVPGGMRKVVCAYCNADNLISMHDYSSKYNCYFCREPL